MVLPKLYHGAGWDSTFWQKHSKTFVWCLIVIYWKSYCSCPHWLTYTIDSLDTILHRTHRTPYCTGLTGHHTAPDSPDTILHRTHRTPYCTGLTGLHTAPDSPDTILHRTDWTPYCTRPNKHHTAPNSQYPVSNGLKLRFLERKHEHGAYLRKTTNNLPKPLRNHSPDCIRNRKPSSPVSNDP